MLAISTILHPTDFSEASRYALDVASGLASDYRASLVIIHVIPAQVILSDGFPIMSPERGFSGVRDQLEELEIPDDGIDVIRHVEEGNPAAEILNLASLCHADLIVMGSHGRAGLSRWFMGSVAEAVMRKATVPVLTVTSKVALCAPSDGLARMRAVHA